MEPEKPEKFPIAPDANPIEMVENPGIAEPVPAAESRHGARWVFLGPDGLRSGWSVLLFLPLFLLFLATSAVAMLHLHLVSRQAGGFTPISAFFSEAGSVAALALAAAIVGLFEGRRILAYNLKGRQKMQHFFFGLAAGFLALSVLVGALRAGGWLHLGAATLSGAAFLHFGLLWGGVFLLTGCFEEGLFRGYLQFTLTRGIDFRWAFVTLATACAGLAIFVGGSASTGVYAAALLGFFPCLYLLQKSAARSAFWYAAWVTSTLFGLVHISNAGESGIGIFAAAAIGFVFCVSVRLTGSAWWAIGCHAAWDWAETFFYGTADSGLTPQGSFLSSHPAGNPFWSGGAVGPEGSVLVLGAILLLLALLLVYGRLSARRNAERIAIVESAHTRGVF